MLFWDCYKTVPDRFIILLGLLGLCPAIWYICLAAVTEVGQKMLGTCIGLAFFHFTISLLVFCYIPVNRSIRKANQRRDPDVEAQINEGLGNGIDVEDTMDGLNGEAPAIDQDVEVGGRDVKTQEDQEAESLV
jgi:hypothetical protein